MINDEKRISSLEQRMESSFVLLEQRIEEIEQNQDLVNSSLRELEQDVLQCQQELEHLRLLLERKSP